MTFAEATALVEKHGSQSAAAEAVGMTRQNISRILTRGDRPLLKPGRPKGSGTGKKRWARVKVASTSTITAASIAPGQARSFGHRMLRDILESGRSSPRQIAKELGIAEVTIEKLRSGATPIPSLPVAVGLERMFGIRCASWLEMP